MAKEDLLPFKYDSKTNTVYNTSGGKIVPVARTKPRTKSWTSTFFDLAARFTAWYALYMIFWACPENARLDPTAPGVCRRVDSIKQSVLPYAKPYYDTYAEPYLAKAQPYLQKGQGYYEQFGAPTVAKGQEIWIKQATPRIKKSYSVAQQQYNKNIYPVLDRTVLRKSRDVYLRYIDPHVETISSHYTRSVHPHVETLQTRSQKLYNEWVIPTYHTSAPRVVHAFRKVEDAYATYIEPRVHAVLKWMVRQIEQVIIPRVTILWGVHVQPQLDRVYDKLFRNRESSQVASKIVDEGRTTQSLLASHASSQYVETHSTPDPVVEPLAEYADETEAEVLSSPTAIEPERPPLNRAVQVDALLENWRTQIRKAGIETEEIFIESVNEIFETEKEREISITKNMVLELNNTVNTELASLENHIMYLAKKGRATDKEDPRLKELNEKVVASGKKIRNHAVEIRNYLKSIKERFEGKILDRRSVAWQTMDAVVGDAQIEIGNLWMWLADITYVDWQEYHGLQDMANTIKQRIHQAGAGKHFDVMAGIQETAEGQINLVAKEAAARLGEIKEIGREKIMLGDGSDNFGKSWVPVGVRLAAEDVKSKASEAVYGKETPTGVVDQILEGVGKATDVVGSAADKAATKVSEAVYGTPQGVVESVMSQASKAVVGEEPPIQSKILSSAQDMLSSAGDIAADAVSKASTAVIGTPQGVGESIASQISTAILGTPQGVVESVVSQATSVVGEAYGSASDYASGVIDDIPSYTDVTDKAKEAASSASSVAGKAFDSASSYASAVIDDMPSYQTVVDKAKAAASSVNSVAGEAISSVSSAAGNAASIVGENAVNVGDRAQKVFKSPEPGIGEKVASKASEAIYGTEPGVVEKATDAAASVGEKVASKASEAIYGTEPGFAEKATDAAVSAGEKIASKASEVIYGTEPGMAEKATDAAKSVGQNVASKASIAVYGTEPGVIEKASSVASSLASEASEAIVGTEPGTMEKATSVVGSVMGEATSKIAEVIEEAGSAASSVASSVASEVTEAYGAATSKVWENK